MRRLPTLGLLLVLAAALLGLAAPAGAQDDAPEENPTTDPGRVSILKVEGLIDPVMADFIERSVRDADAAGLVAVVLQLDSEGAVVSDARLVELARLFDEVDVPVAVWVGPSGSRALGGAAQLAGAADLVGLAPGSRIGRTGDLVVPADLLSEGFLAAQGRLRTGTINEEQARGLGVAAEHEAPVIGEFLIEIDGFESREVEVEDRTVREPLTVPVFSALPIQDQLFHTVASPPAAYLLFLIGLSLIVFEMFTAGVGVAGLVGAGAFVLGSYGFAVLPTRPWAVALLVLAIFGFSVDIQTGVPRVWTGIGAGALAVGSFAIYDGFSLSWVALLVGIGGMILFALAGMPAMVRTRFSTPTIGREWMIGEEGEAVTEISPDGVVRVRGALWRARTNRATPLALHDQVRVVEVDGLLLEVEPIDGGAVDYREKRRSGDGDAATERSDGGVVLVDGEPLVDPDAGR